MLAPSSIVTYYSVVPPKKHRRYIRALPKAEHTSYIGVFPFTQTKSGQVRFRAQVTVDSKCRYIGTYSNDRDAATAYDAYVREHKLGKPLNFPEEEALYETAS